MGLLVCSLILSTSHQKLIYLVPGHSVVEVRMLFRPYWNAGSDVMDSNFPYLAYCQRFDIVLQSETPGGRRLPIADPAAGMYVMKRALRADTSRIGDIVPLCRLRTPLDLAPLCGAKADTHFTSKNSCKYASEFHLNKYWDKEIFASIY